MLTVQGRAFVSVLLEDRERNQGRTSIWLPHGISSSDIASAMDIFIGGLNSISDAYVRSYKVLRKFEAETADIADIGSDVVRRLALYYRNAGVYEAVWLPSARQSITESVGPYAGIRVDNERTDVALALADMQTILDFIVLPDGSIYPDEYVTGGIAL